MLLSKNHLLALGCVILASGCAKTNVSYTCPFGVGYLTETDYETMQNPELISDNFVNWLLKTNKFCEANNV